LAFWPSLRPSIEIMVHFCLIKNSHSLIYVIDEYFFYRLLRQVKILVIGNWELGIGNWQFVIGN